MTSACAALKATGLRRRLRRTPWSRGHLAVQDVSLQVEPGEIVGLLGPNGAGKTTTFRMLAGLLRPHRGEIHLGDQAMARWPLWRRARAGLGYLPQRPTLIPEMTTSQNVELGLRGQGLPARARRQRAAALLSQFGLSHVTDAPARTLSGGERRRAEVVRAFAARPQVLLVDEPFAGLDPKAAALLVEQLRALAREGTGVLLTDHHVGRAFEACERAYIISAGVVLLEGEPAAIAADERAREAWLGSGFPRRAEPQGGVR